MGTEAFKKWLEQQTEAARAAAETIAAALSSLPAAAPEALAPTKQAKEIYAEALLGASAAAAAALNALDK
ncbi:hypothetical protein ENH_00058170 [Eimeria necatrix]|uniref:Uncharacterized protein n=1 Tax=Eimeria necatrix TaxID=51315 RepID=U6MQZ0_9EIME|nr:hypothetical protein ENH_00058170 [Eimeria necatrix]CDJ64040.1 hypothetical protein ENH_00058170 [Eimeria necatrix]